jgi:hypothetical protein
MRFTDRVEKLAEGYLRRAVGISDDDPVPHVRLAHVEVHGILTKKSFMQYITIHMRRDDFKNICDVPVHECLANFTVIARRVAEVQEELRERKGIDAKHVIMTSDEKDPAWWSDVEAQGWLRIDHSMTEKTFGRWSVLFFLLLLLWLTLDVPGIHW